MEFSHLNKMLPLTKKKTITKKQQNLSPCAVCHATIVYVTHLFIYFQLIHFVGHWLGLKKKIYGSLKI